ncbi:MAG: hypothetical protein NVSMB44_04180 [Ktedonobacteraceae bacterium]
MHPEKEYRPHVNELKPPREERPPHPRFLSRPEVRRAREAKRDEEYAQQFEGDYEQFDAEQAALPAEHPGPSHAPREEYQSRDRHDNNQKRERFVTPLPDGRVLKGPRPVQRKNAQFWTDINNEAETLVDQVQIAEPETAGMLDPEREPLAQGEQAEPIEHTEQTDTDATTTLEAGTQPVKRTPGVVRRKKAEATKKPRSTGPKPSQKGYKWPTA